MIGSVLPLELLSSIVEYLKVSDLLHLDMCSKHLSQQLEMYRVCRFKLLSQSTSISWSQILKPHILITCNQKNYLFDLFTHKFQVYPIMQESRFTRYLYHIFTRNKREVVCLSTSYQHRKGAMETLNFIDSIWRTHPKRSIVDHLSGFSGT